MVEKVDLEAYRCDFYFSTFIRGENGRKVDLEAPIYEFKPQFAHFAHLAHFFLLFYFSTGG